MDSIVVSLILLIVAIPEGLPMTVAVSLAYSVLVMDDSDHVLVRDLESVEQVGLVNELVLGKTGTMTTEDMKVLRFFAQNTTRLNSRKDTLMNVKLTDEVIKKICEGILYNSTAYIEMSENSFYVPVGQGTEVSLIKWLQDAEIAVHETLSPKKRSALVRAQVPFSSALKRSVTCIKHPELEDMVRIFVKGAPENVIPDCVDTYDEDGNKVPLDEDLRGKLEEELGKFTQERLRPIAFSFRDVPVDEFDDLMARAGAEIDTDEEVREIVGEQTFVAMVGLSDPLRPQLKQVVKTAANAGISLRLCSGDHLQTAKAAACDAGIIDESEYAMTENPDQPIAMEASAFREAVGPIQEVEEGDEGVVSYRVRDQQEFNRLLRSLKVIGRALPSDKLLLVAGLSQMPVHPDGDDQALRRVAVVGEGINDVKAFKAAQVSFAMGEGTSLARNNASMVLTTNEFASGLQAVMWGRNIYTNVQRFLQFQITCNLSALVVVIVGYLTLQESPLNPTQLIYINLIMDIFGAIGLASTRPNAETARAKYDEGKLMKPQMYRQIVGMALYMIAMMMIVMYAGKSFFGEDEAPLKYEKGEMTTTSDPKRLHFTLIFNTFVFLQVFNMVNCREVSPTKGNGFAGLWGNWYTILVLAIIVATQVVTCFTFIGGILFEAASDVDTQNFFTCILIGASCCLADALLKYIPLHWVAKVPQLDEQKALGQDNVLIRAYDQQANAKAYTGKQAPAVDIDDSAE